MEKIKQFIQFRDTDGMLKNLSELLQEIRDKNITSLYLGYTRKDDSMRTFWFGAKGLPEFVLLLEQTKYDLVTHRWDDEFARSFEK